MKPTKLLISVCLVLSALAFLPGLVTPAFAAESVTCPNSVHLSPGQTVTVVCTSTWDSGSGAAQTSSVACSASFTCTGWSFGSVSPASFGSGHKSGSQTLQFTITAPTASTCNTYSDCTTQITLTTSGGGFGVIAASATITITAPEFGLGIASVVAIGFVAMAFLRKGRIQVGPVTSAV